MWAVAWRDDCLGDVAFFDFAVAFIASFSWPLIFGRSLLKCAKSREPHAENGCTTSN